MSCVRILSISTCMEVDGFPCGSPSFSRSRSDCLPRRTATSWFGADHVGIVEQLAAVGTVANAQLLQPSLAAAPVDGCRMIFIVEHRPNLEAGIGDGYVDSLLLCKSQRLVEPLVFVLVEHGPDIRLRTVPCSPLEFYRLLHDSLWIEPCPFETNVRRSAYASERSYVLRFSLLALRHHNQQRSDCSLRPATRRPS